MKMKINYIDNQINISNGVVNVIEIENKRYFYRIVSNINEIEIKGYSDSISFFNDVEEQSMSNNIKVFMDYFNLQFNSKKYDKDINKYVINLIDVESHNKIFNQYNKMIKIFKKMLTNSDIPLNITDEMSIDLIIKMIKIRIEKSENLLDNLFLIIDLEKTLNLNNILFFINLKQYLNDIELIELYKYSIYNNINILLIDSQSYKCKLKYEKKLLIDEELDEFVI